MINPAISYKKEMNELIPSTKDIENATESQAIRWNKLYDKCHKECTHKNESGNNSWRQLSDDLWYCPYCDAND